MNHRDAGAFEKRSPSESEWKAQQASATEPTQPAQSRTSMPSQTAPRPSSSTSAQVSAANPSQEILVVVSKVKEYIRSKSGMNTSDAVMARLSTWVTRWCNDSIRIAQQHDRKTVLDRDVR
jgi:hypothetical protein